jgi:ABC-2 type transport system ATP-binding protein
MLTLKDIVKAYHDTVILEIPELTLEHEIYWLLGGNGAGKTTGMKVMAGLVPFKGDILVDNNVSCHKQPVQYRRLVNYAEAEPLYPGFLTGNDLVNLYIQTKGKGYKDIKELITLLGINTYIQSPVSTYSSGMLKKLSLLLAFTGTPKVILLDEPLITLDTQTVPLINNMVQEFYTQYGVTFCITSHQPVSTSYVQLQVQGKHIVKI